MVAQKIIVTRTDEAPELSRLSEQPVFERFLDAADIEVEVADISLSARILAAFPDHLESDQIQNDDLAELGRLVQEPGTVIIKLPNISASIPQIKAAVAELQSRGYNVPDYPDEPGNPDQEEIKNIYDNAIKGSVVNPVLRNGNSLRKPIPAAKKAAHAAEKNSNREWAEDSKTSVAHMTEGDFRNSERSTTLDGKNEASIIFVDADGNETVLKEGIALEDKEVIDTSVMNVKALCAFLDEQIAAAKEEGTLFSLHMKATMMKVSDPIIFGHAVEVYFESVFKEYGDLFEEIGVNPRNGFGSVLEKVEAIEDDALRKQVLADIEQCYVDQADLYMVDSDIGKTNLHVPSDVIIDASMPAMLKAGGIGWNADGKAQDTRAVIPDGTYAPVYKAMVEDCQGNGAFDSRTMGSVTNIGLMARKAEEYGSHDKTFEAPGAGTIKVVGKNGETLQSQNVEEGDIFRMCQAKDEPIRDWIKVAINESKLTGSPVVFWLDETRAHDAEIIKRVQEHWNEFGGEGEPTIMNYADATKHTNALIRDGKNVIGATGNVLRDYLTDLYPILELGTSAKMVSKVSMIVDGDSVMFETGAGGSAPKHVQQMVAEGHLRWDSLGEIAAFEEALRHLSKSCNNVKAKILADTLNDATVKMLNENQSPGRKVGEIDTRGSHFYLSLYWAEALAAQDENAELKAEFEPVAAKLRAEEPEFIKQHLDGQGNKTNLGGYYRFGDEAEKEMNKTAPLLAA